MAYVGNQTDNESSGCQSQEIRRSKLDTDLATYRLLRNKVSARLKLSFFLNLQLRSCLQRNTLSSQQWVSRLCLSNLNA